MILESIYDHFCIITVLVSYCNKFYTSKLLQTSRINYFLVSQHLSFLMYLSTNIKETLSYWALLVTQRMSRQIEQNMGQIYLKSTMNPA